MSIYDRIISPLLKNLPLFTLSWALVALIAVVAKDETCRNLPMGSAESMVGRALGLEWKNSVLALLVFYLFAGLAFAFTGKSGRLEEIQDKFFRPVVVPVLFQIAGLAGGLTASENSPNASWIAAAQTIAIVLLALAIHNSSELLTPAQKGVA